MIVADDVKVYEPVLPSFTPRYRPFPEMEFVPPDWIDPGAELSTYTCSVDERLPPLSI